MSCLLRCPYFRGDQIKRGSTVYIETHRSRKGTSAMCWTLLTRRSRSNGIVTGHGHVSTIGG